MPKPTISKVFVCAISALTLGAFVATSQVALADPPAHAQNKGHGKGNKGNKGNKGKSKGRSGVSYGAIHHRGGPPPWAPAHGYRNNSGHGGNYNGGDYAYIAPYGIDGGHCNRKEVGIVLGGLSGGLIGSRIAGKDDKTLGIIAGAVIGAVIGGKIGNSMDKTDQNCVGQTLEHAPDGREVTWQNPDTNTSYDVTPVKTYQESENRYCREYQTTSVVDGRSQETYGKACRGEDGAWELVS